MRGLGSEREDWETGIGRQELGDFNILRAHCLKTEIEETDKEIDQMVYELYGLSEDENSGVENS